MKAGKFFTALTLVVLLGLTATVVLAAASPYLIDSYWMTDPLDPSVSWWRDTANQNAIAQHTADQFPDTAYVQTAYSDSNLKILVYHSVSGPNVIAVMETYGSDLVLIGPGGGRNEASNAKIAFQMYYPGFTSKSLRGIVLTGASPEESWGGTYWGAVFGGYPISYASAAFPDAKADLNAVVAAFSARQAKALGQNLTWGPDGFLGAGSMKEYDPELTSYAPPFPPLISEPTLVHVGDRDLYLVPTPGESAGLAVYWISGTSYSCPHAPQDFCIDGYVYALRGILSMPGMATYLPDLGSIYRANAPVQEQIAALNQVLPLVANGDWAGDFTDFLLLSAGGQLTFSYEDAISALTAQRDVLQSIYDQTIAQINQGATIDEAAAAVTLSPDLAASPYAQEFVSTIPGLVRSIYQEKMGWFGGDVTDLTSTLTEAGKAQALVDAFGLEALVAAARDAELGAQDLPAAEKALYLAYAAYKGAPDDFEVKRIYAQALRKNAFMQKSAQTRNYYLTIAQELGTEQIVTDLAKSGDEDTAIAFSAAEFSQHFMGVSGSLLTTVRIDSLPENGVLSLAGVEVVAGQEIALAELDGLVFTPDADWNGTTSFLWNGKDGDAYAANDATVTITLNPVNDAPAVSAAQLADVTADEDAAGHSVDLAAGFTDVDGDALAFTVENSNTGLLSASLDGTNLSLAFLGDQNGTATVAVTAFDPSGASATAAFDVTVNPVNDAPTAADAAITVVAGQSQAITLDYSDLETAQASLQVAFSGPANGTIDTSALPGLTYAAPAGFAGDDSFTYTVTDGGDPDGCVEAPCAAPQSATATIYVTVVPAPSGSIGGLVWNDANGDGILDEGEPGWEGVTVELLDADGNVIGTATTAADGSYAFSGLAGGTYSVRQSLLPGAVATTPEQVDLTLAEDGAETVDFGQVVSADLRVDMTYSVNRKQIIYTITVTNDGPADALDAVLSDVLPDGVAYVSVISTQGTCSGGKTVSCEFGTLASGQSATVILKVNRTDNKNAIVNTVTVTSSIFDIDLADNSATVTIE